MSLDIGHLTFLAPSEGAWQDWTDADVPSTPPAEVLDAVDAAFERAEQLAHENRELHFGIDERTGRVRIQVRDLDGRVIRDIPPSSALAMLAGDGFQETI